MHGRDLGTVVYAWVSMRLKGGRRSGGRDCEVAGRPGERSAVERCPSARGGARTSTETTRSRNP